MTDILLITFSKTYHSIQCSILLLFQPTGVPTINCPSVPTSTNSQVTFNTPTVTLFSGTVNYVYTYSNSNSNPPIVNQQLATLNSGSASHSLFNLQTGSNVISIRATDNNGNSATCQFTYIRTGKSDRKDKPKFTDCNKVYIRIHSKNLV